MKKYVFILALIAVTGAACFYLYHKKKIPVAIAATEKETLGELTQAQVRMRPLSAAISMAGIITPKKEASVTAPFEGRIKQIFFTWGQRVEKGDELLVMDTSKLAMEFRDARSKVIEAELKHRALKNWKTGREVAKARRALTKAKSNLDSAKRILEEDKVLFDKGIIAESELISARKDHANRILELIAAREEFTSVLDEGGPEQMEMAQIALANARVGLEEIKVRMGNSRVRALISGVVLAADPHKENDSPGKVIAPGTSVALGELILKIGNLEGVSVKATVDEADIGKVYPGQTVRVSGDGFPGIILNGKVTVVSDMAASSGAGQGPVFPVTVTIACLTAEQQQLLRLGMSANLSIKIYDNPQGLVVPLDAVTLRKGQKYVMVRDQTTGSLVEKNIRTGITTLRDVEVKAGLAKGDIVYFSPAQPEMSAWSPKGRK